MERLDRRDFTRLLSAVGVAGTAVALAPVAASAAQSGASGSSSSAAAATGTSAADEDRQLDAIVEALEALPEDLKNADPSTTEGYQERLEKELDGVTVVSERSQEGAVPVVNWGSCALALAGVIVEYGIPVAKVISWIRKARRLYGGISGIVSAIRNGMAAAEIGEDAAMVLAGILGLDGVKDACFS